MFFRSKFEREMHLCRYVFASAKQLFVKQQSFMWFTFTTLWWGQESIPVVMEFSSRACPGFTWQSTLSMCRAVMLGSERLKCSLSMSRTLGSKGRLFSGKSSDSKSSSWKHEVVSICMQNTKVKTLIYLTLTLVILSKNVHFYHFFYNFLSVLYKNPPLFCLLFLHTKTFSFRIPQISLHS